MWTNIILVIFGLMVLSASFLVGLFVGFGSALNIMESDIQSGDYLFCFDCETETPVKEIKGAMYCSECGLNHTNDFH